MVPVKAGTWYWVTKNAQAKGTTPTARSIEVQALHVHERPDPVRYPDERWVFLTRAGGHIVRFASQIQTKERPNHQDELEVLKDALLEMNCRFDMRVNTHSVEITLSTEMALKYLALLRQAYQAERSKVEP